MPRKRPKPGAAPGEDKQDKSHRKNVSGTGSRSAFVEMRRRARETPSSDPAGRPDETARLEDEGSPGKGPVNRSDPKT